MRRLVPLMMIVFSVIFATASRSEVRESDFRQDGSSDSGEAASPIGKWSIQFANQVTEQSDIFKFDGELHTTVDEPRRRSRGRMAASEGAFVITYNDDRIERWTPVGKRFVVEHWFPGSRFPNSSPVLGIADRTP